MDKKVLAGTAIILNKNGKVLFGLRRGKHGAETWSPPGGHIEFGEDPASAVVRETLEETGINIKQTEFIGFTNDVFKETGKHYITLWFRASTDEEPKTTAPNELGNWGWFAWNELPKPLFLPVTNLINSGLIENLK